MPASRSCCDTTRSHGRLVSYEGFDSGPYRTHRREPKFPLYPHSPPSEILLMADAQSPLNPAASEGAAVLIWLCSAAALCPVAW
jgi:hypothetical protein